MLSLPFTRGQQLLEAVVQVRVGVRQIANQERFYLITFLLKLKLFCRLLMLMAKLVQNDMEKC